MKRRTKIILIAAAAAAVAVAVWLIFFNPFVTVEVKKSKENNAYNNTRVYGSADLLQMGDKLYYHYDNSRPFTQTGTYVITDKKRELLSEALLPLDSPMNGKLEDFTVMPPQIYDEKTGEFVTDKKYVVPEDMKNATVFTRDNTPYLISNQTLYSYKNNKAVLLADTLDLKLEGYDLSPENIYLDKNWLYYKNRSGKELQLCRYHLKTKQIESLKIGEDCDTFLACGDKVYARAGRNKLYRADFADASVTLLRQTEGELLFNCFGNTLYFAVQSQDDDAGVYTLSKGGTLRKISNERINRLYLLDDDYLYYTDDSGSLRRMTTDGKTVETVF